MDSFHICLVLCFRSTRTKVMILDAEVMRFNNCFFLFLLYIRLKLSLIAKQFIFSRNIVASGFQAPEYICGRCITDCIKLLVRILRKIFGMIGR